MDNIDNSRNINNMQPPKNLPKKLPPELLRARQNSQGLPPKAPSNFQQPQRVNATPKPTNQPTLNIAEQTKNNAFKNNQLQKVDNVVHQSDKETLKNYNQAVSYYRKTVKHYKKRVLKTDLKLKPVKDVFNNNIPDTLWFFERRKIRAILNKLDLAISYSVSKNRGVVKGIIIAVLILAIIATGVYFSLIITRNLNPNDAKTVGEINLDFSDIGAIETKKGKTNLKIVDARLNQDLKASPTIYNRTNISLYLRFYIELDYVRGKDYVGVNINDLSVKANLDPNLWWYDETDGMAYYLFTLSPDESMALFNSFQINGQPSLETAWQNKSLTATINAEVCQVLGEGQEFPPSWSTYWSEELVSQAHRQDTTNNENDEEQNENQTQNE